jgi:hypothetical protein
MVLFRRRKSHPSGGGSPTPAEDAAKTLRELAVALRALGWELKGPERTSGGWKASIQRGSESAVFTGSKPEKVLEDLLRNAKQAERP